MALTALITEMLGPALKPGNRVASMGYPDMIAPIPVFERILGEKFADLEYRPDSEKICRWHGLEQHKIPDAHSFFRLMGAKLDVYDIVEARGGEILCDLNHPMREREIYDFVLDVGTIEHCFNIGQAALNMAGMLKQGGTIYHSNPHNAGNHGFYGISPTWYSDFYGQPGFRLLFCKLMAKRTDTPVDAPPVGRFFAQAEADIFAGAVRDEVLPIGFPMQAKYRR